LDSIPVFKNLVGLLYMVVEKSYCLKKLIYFSLQLNGVCWLTCVPCSKEDLSAAS